MTDKQGSPKTTSKTTKVSSLSQEMKNLTAFRPRTVSNGVELDEGITEFIEWYDKDLIWSWLRLRKRSNMNFGDVADWLNKHFPIPEGWNTRPVINTLFRLREWVEENADTEVDTST